MVMPEAFRIDQVVHGYSRGHKELAQTVELDDRARSTMIVMSDLLVTRVPEAKESYLTCYPLPSVARHVLARTWSAGSDYRPGSVWTHSLLIDYPTLAQLHDLAELAGLLKRPTGKLTGLDKPLTLRPSATHSQLVFDSHAARSAIAGLYGEDARACVLIPTSDSAQNEALALALWRQAWPGLRRDFGFVSALSDRPIAIECGCSLSFVRETLGNPELDLGTDTLLQDLPKPGPTSLRSFVSRYVVEAPEPRSAAPSVAMIFALSESTYDVEATSLANLAQVRGLLRLKRDLIAAKLQSAIEPDALVRLVCEFRDEPFASLPYLVHNCLAKMSTAQLKTIVQNGLGAANETLGWLLLHKVLTLTDARHLAEIADDSSRHLFLEQRPEIAEFAAFWPSGDDDRAEFLGEVLPRIQLNLEGLFSMFGGTLGPRAATVIIDQAVEGHPAAIRELLNERRPTIRQAALALLGSNAFLASRVVADLGPEHFGHLDAIAQAVIAARSGLVSPERWVEAMERMRRDRGHVFGPWSSVVALIAALRIGNVSTLDLAVAVFEPLLDKAKRHKLGYECDYWISRELPARARGYSVASRMRSTAVSTWPAGPAHAGALLLCARSENVREMIDEVVSIQGKTSLQAALHDPGLSRNVREKIVKKLAPPKLRLDLFNF